MLSVMCVFNGLVGRDYIGIARILPTENRESGTKSAVMATVNIYETDFVTFDAEKRRKLRRMKFGETSRQV